MSVRVRFAPSPTGPLHMGGVRTALYNYLFARKHGGRFILRIEDTDQARTVPGAEAYIMEALDWCGLTPDEGPKQGGPTGPYRQSERKAMYREYAERLVAEDKAYYAFDLTAELDAMRDRLKAAGVAAPAYNAVTREHMKNSLTLGADEVKARLANGEEHVVRLKVPRQHEVRFEDTIRGWVVVHSGNIDDKVLFKSDGWPTYHLANIVDDHTMEITHVIRGEEWLPSAPLHVLLYEAFGWERPAFAHLPLILKPDGNGKLSKRDGDRLGFPVFPLDWADPASGEKSSGYRERGYYPEAFVNMLALLGWNPGTEQEIFTLEELTHLFDLDRVHKGGARFDPEKTRWFNQQYLRMRPDAELGTQLRARMKERGVDIAPEKAVEAAHLLKERATFPSDMLEGDYLFSTGSPLNGNVLVQEELKKKWKPETAPALEHFISILGGLSDFQTATIESAFNEMLKERGLKIGQVMPLYRLFVAGRLQGPGMFDVSALLGKEEVIDPVEGRARTMQGMGLIEVKGIRVYAYHGCLTEEGRIGGHYSVDVSINSDLSSAEKSDRLHDTIDYGRVTAIVKEQMAERANLIEHVCRRILDALVAEWPGRAKWKVRLVKEHPPVAGAVDHVVYALEG